MEIELFYKKMEVLTCYINKYISSIENSEEKIDLLNTNIEKNKENIKTFIAKTLSHKINLVDRSTKLFQTEYYLYNTLKKTWKLFTPEDRTLVWNLLSEMFILSVKIFPVIKPSEYSYVSLYLHLEEISSDIITSKLSSLVIVSALFKEVYNHLNKELESGNISKDVIENIMNEFKSESITNMQKPNYLKNKMMSIMEKKEIKYVIDILKTYFTESIMLRLKNECIKVFESQNFKNFTKNFNKDKLMSMVQNNELNFVNIRQMVYDSGLIDLLGEDFVFPNNFDEFNEMIEKYSGHKMKGTDLKSFFEENIKSLLELPQVKKFIKKSGYKDILNPILNFFHKEKRDFKAEKLSRQQRRRNQRLGIEEHEEIKPIDSDDDEDEDKENDENDNVNFQSLKESIEKHLEKTMNTK